MMERLKIGLIRKARGLKGEVKVLPLTDDPRRFKKVSAVYLDGDDAEFEIEYAAVTHKEVIIKFGGVDTVEQAQSLSGRHIYIEKSDGVPLDEWEYYTQDIVGCNVKFGETDIGQVTDVMNCGANDNMLVRTADGREIYYPFIRTFIDSIDTEKKLIVINQTEDFFDI